MAGTQRRQYRTGTNVGSGTAVGANNAEGDRRECKCNATTLHFGVRVWEQCGLSGKVRLQGSWIGMGDRRSKRMQ